MSNQAVGWAFRQKVPAIPKLVLLALCDRANKDTGECWPGIETIAEDCSLSPRSVVTYIAGLVRNGYVEKQLLRTKDGKRRANHYWVLFDRVEADWITVEQNSTNQDDPLEDTDQCANRAHGCEEPESSDQSAQPAHGQHATVCTLHMMPEPESIEPVESVQVEGPARIPDALPEEPKPAKRTNFQGFDRSKRQAEQDRIAAADKARRPQRLFVFEGSDPWKAHVRNGHPPTLKTWGEINGKRCQGWYFPTLYPPKSTGPPSDHLTESDIEELAKG